MDPKPLIRWAGSKRKLLPILRTRVPRYRRYIEPFAGSACLFFHLKPRLAILSDFNHDLISTYRHVRDVPLQLASLLLAYDQTAHEYYRVREKFNKEGDSLLRSMYFLYLNRFCFNGVFRTNKSGAFNVPRGSKTGNLPNAEVLLGTSRLLKGAELVTADFEESLSRADTGDFVYLDPPYAQGARSSFEYGIGAFCTQDLHRLFKNLYALHRKRVKFLLSYSYDRAVWTECRRRWKCEVVQVERHIAGFNEYRGTVKELLISNLP